MKNFTMITLTVLMLAASACSKDKSNKKAAAPAPKQDQVTVTGLEGMESVTWKLLLQGNMFPAKTRVDINGVTVLDECLGKQENRIDREAAPQSLTVANFTVPTAGQVKILVLDLGDCTTETTFIHNENVAFEVVKGTVANEVAINL